MVSNCQSCTQEQQEQHQSSSPTEAAAANQLRMWCHGHQDTQDLVAGTLLGGSGSIKDEQHRQYYALSSPEYSFDQGAAAVLRGIHRSNDSRLGSQQQQAQTAAGSPQPVSTGRRVSMTAGVARDNNDDDDDDHPVFNHRSPRDYDLVVEMAAAAAAAAEAKDDHDSQLALAPNSKPQQEMEDLQRLQEELQQAVEYLGIQGMQLPPAQAPPLQPQGSNHGLTLDAAFALTKRRRLEQQEQQQDLPHPAAVSASGVTCYNAGMYQLQAQQQLQQQQRQRLQQLMMIRSPSPSGPVDPKRSRAPPVPRCGQCKTCNNLTLRKGCAVNRRRYAQGLPFIVPHGADRIPRSVAKQHALAAARASAVGSSGAAATMGNGLGGLLLSSAGFMPVSSAAATGLGSGSAIAAAAGQATGAVGARAGLNSAGGFTPAVVTAAPPAHSNSAAVVQQKGEASVKLEDQSDQQQQQQQQQQLQDDKTASPTAGATIYAEGLLKSLNQQIDALFADISSWCSSNLAADHADVDKTLQVLQQLKQQLWHNYQQTGQQLFINGLEILGGIVGAFTALPAAGAKVVLACNSQRRVSGTCCPDNQPCSVLELIMSCWFKEMQDSGVTGGDADCKDTATADGGSPRFEHPSDLIKQLQAIRSGQCQAVLRLIAQLSALQFQVYYGPLAARERQQIQEQKEVAAALREAVIYVMSGTALLMLQGPEVESAEVGRRWGELAAQWQQCLLQCKWAVANKPAVGSAGGAVVSVLRELGRVVDQLVALKGSETINM